MPTAIVASDYSVELRSKAGALKAYLTPFVTGLGWEFNRIGGCGRCKIALKKNYRDILFDSQDDIRIRVRDNDNLAWDPFTKLVSSFDGADGAVAYTDPVAGAYTFVGTAQLDTAQKKNGTAALLLDGNSDYLTLPDSANWYFGAGNFRIDCDVRFASVDGDQLFVGQYTAGTYWQVYKAQTTHKLTMIFYDGANKGSYVMTSNWAPVVNTWYHLTFIRNGTTALIFIDGLSQTLTETTAFGANDVGNAAAVLLVGGGWVSGNYINGWMDNLRIQKGTTGGIVNFSPPVNAYTQTVYTSKLVYRGFIANIIPSLKINQDVVLDVRGYFDLLKKIVIHNLGDTKTYSASKVSTIVGSIADDFIVAKSDITKGTVEDGSYTTALDTIEFLGTVEDALRTLADIAGDIEYGVDENIIFYWKAESTTLRHRFFIGNNVALFERKISFDNLVNKFYLIGGDVAGAKYKKTGENTDSQAIHGIREEILNNSSIVSDGVATQYMTALLTEKASPVFTIRAEIKNTNLRLEDTVPIGLISFYDAAYDREQIGDVVGDIIGLTADGGSDIIIGLTADGGDNATVGGQFSAQLDRVEYSLSNSPGKFNLGISLGDAISETASKLKRLERELASVTKY